jgi:hypothetical protein
MMIQVLGEEDKLVFKCYDEDLIRDTVVGEASFKVRELLFSNPTYVSLFHKGKKAADI